MSNEQYHSSAGISKSHLDDIAPPNSPLHYWAKRIDPDREPEVRIEALILGDAIHKAVLEPDLVEQHFAVVPDDAPSKPSSRQRTAKKPSADSVSAIAWWDDFLADCAGKTVLKPEQFQTVVGVRDAVHRHPIARGLFKGGVAEQTYFALDSETGELVKCRLDYDRLQDCGMIVDLKTTESAGDDAFGHSATKYRYDVQGVWYPDVLKSLYREAVVDTFAFVAVEKNWPHAIGIYYLDEEDAAAARPYARRDLHSIIECRKTGVWPDFATQASRLRIRKNMRRFDNI